LPGQLPPSGQEVTVPQAPEPPVVDQPAGEVAIPDWLRSLAPDVAVGEPVASQPEVGEALPDWLAPKPVTDAGVPAEVAAAPAAAELPATAAEPESSVPQTAPAKEEVFQNWMNDMGARATAAGVSAAATVPAIEQPVAGGSVPAPQEPTPPYRLHRQSRFRPGRASLRSLQAKLNPLILGMMHWRGWKAWRRSRVPSLRSC